MSSSTEPIEAVSQRLDTFLTEQRVLATENGAEARLFIETGARALSGGKRLRARFCLAGWRTVEDSSDPRESGFPPSLVAAAAALEVFHAAALVHDDLIDNSDTRRGRPATHRTLESEHRRASWVGDSEQFGRSSAILLGDLLVAWSDDLFESGLDGVETRIASAARSEYASMRRDVTIGQFLDIAEESAFISEPDENHAARALRVASLKSARYSIQQPLVIGAALAGADDVARTALVAYGHPLGMAFQLRDDVLGVFGDESETGKPSGDDLREGKRTVLVAYTRESLSRRDRAAFDALLGDPTLGAEQIASLQSTIVTTGALDRVETLIADYALESERALESAGWNDAAVRSLNELARAATVRRT